MPKATSLVAEFKQALGVDAELIKSSNGIFDVSVDGKLVFSKYQTGRFPEPGEVVATLKKAKLE
ncbi:MAG: SelT/SelW/SelH family protein [Deinococcus sp.]|nr:SelT/SelW/SelH family protein [Deinococcus sp.]